MLTVAYNRWGQDPEILRVLGLNAEHPRTREHFLAWYAICGKKNASQVGRETGRNPPMVMAWVHRYHTVGPAALVYQPTGGRPSFYPAPGTAGRHPAAGADGATPPALDPEAVADLAPGQGQNECCRETIRQALKQLAWSWKKARTRLNRADPDQRAAFLEQLNPLALDRHPWPPRFSLYRRSPFPPGYRRRLWRVDQRRAVLGQFQFAAARGEGIVLRGLLLSQGRVKLCPYERASSETTLERLETLRREVPEMPLTVLWDGASSYRAKAVLQRVEELQINVLPLPAYRPDFMPVEPLWQGVREDVRYHTGYDSREELIAQLEPFQ